MRHRCTAVFALCFLAGALPALAQNHGHSPVRQGLAGHPGLANGLLGNDLTGSAPHPAATLGAAHAAGAVGRPPGPPGLDAAAPRVEDPAGIPASAHGRKGKNSGATNAKAAGTATPPGGRPAKGDIRSLPTCE